LSRPTFAMSGNKYRCVVSGSCSPEATSDGNATLTVAKKELTVTGLSITSKTYDGSTSATLAGSASLSGIESLDVVNINGSPTATYNNKNVGSGKAITLSANYTLSGAQAGNYSITQPTLTGAITQKGITITGETASNKTYDRTNTATPGGTGSLVGVESGDVVSITVGTASFGNKDVGTAKSVTFSGYGLSGSDAGNYALSSQPASSTANITQKGLTITGETAANKTYDGNADATPGSAGSLVGIVSGDVVTITVGTAGFDNKNNGNGKTVTFSGYGITGTDAGNYTLSSQPANSTANITKKPLTITGVTASNKIYNGTATATATGTAALSGVVGSEDVSITAGSAEFDSKNVGTGKAVSFSGYGITGTDAGNYTVSQPAPTTANITAKNLTISGLTADNKVYDGNASASILGSGSLVGVVGSEVVTFTTGSATFDNKNIGTGKTVTFSSFTLGGDDAGNYTLSQPSAVTATLHLKD